MILVRMLCLVFLVLIPVGVVGSSVPASAKSGTVRIALLHVNPGLGDLEGNTRMVADAMQQAKAAGAQWVLTPELVLTGYKFGSVLGTDWFSSGPDAHVKALQQKADEMNLVLFLSHLEKDEETEAVYNTLFVIDRAGRIIARHRKINTIPIAEDWSRPGIEATSVEVDGWQLGLMICADAWPDKPTAALKARGVDLVLASATWPPGEYGPGDVWERRSLELNAPLIVSNRTGVEEDFDMRRGSSVVAISGQRVFQFESQENTLLILSLNPSRGELVNQDILRLGALR